MLSPQKRLEDTEHALFDLEERYRQANATIKEKEYLISNLLKSGEWGETGLLWISFKIYLFNVCCVLGIICCNPEHVLYLCWGQIF